MRSKISLLDRYRDRWLELFLLVGFLALLIWLGATVAPYVTPVIRALLPAGRGAFNGEAAYKHLEAQVAFGPRPTGSEANRQTADYIITQLEQFGWQVETQDFTYRETPARNIIARAGSGPVVIIGAHYDTRRQADQDPNPDLRTQPVLGANDGASGVAVLLELARVLDRKRLEQEVWLTFFDAEDNGRLDGWDFVAGSTHMANTLTIRPEMVIIVDMIGDADQQIYRERTSTPALTTRIWNIAADLGYEDAFIPLEKYSITDDHTPFLRLGIPAVDLIDFDYPYWHTTQDTLDKTSPESLTRVGRVLQALLKEPAGDKEQ